MDDGGDEFVRIWRADPGHAGVLVDFDGTLAPIVDDPAAAVALPGVVDVLGVLAGRCGCVGVVSGRPVRYLQERLARPGAPVDPALILSGLYGLEGATGGVISVRPEAVKWEPVVADVGRDAEARAPSGVGVEHKGLTVTLHARRSPDRLGWIERFAANAAARTGLETSPGKMLVELRPPLGIDKGTIVGELAADLRCVVFAGDDIGDLPAFAALGRLRDDAITTLAVAARSAESPPDLLAGADVVVDGPSGVLSFLRRLAA